MMSAISCCISSCFLVLVMHFKLSSVSTFQECKCFVSAGSDGVNGVGVSISFRSLSCSFFKPCLRQWRLGLKLPFGNGCVLEADLKRSTRDLR